MKKFMMVFSLWAAVYFLNPWAVSAFNDDLNVPPHHGKAGIAYPDPSMEEKPSSDYEVSVRAKNETWKPVFAYRAQQHQPGKPNDQELESFAGFDVRGEVEVLIRVHEPVPNPTLDNVLVRPLKAGVKPAIDSAARTIAFRIDPDALDRHRSSGHVLTVKDSEGVLIEGITIRHALGFLLGRPGLHECPRHPCQVPGVPGSCFERRHPDGRDDRCPDRSLFRQ